MPTEPRPIVLSASDLVGTMLIDHGNTVAVQLKTPEGNLVTILVPRAVASRLSDELSKTLAAGTKPQPGH